MSLFIQFQDRLFSFISSVSLVIFSSRLLKELQAIAKGSVKVLHFCPRCPRISRAKRQNPQHLGQIPKAVTGAACPTLAQPQPSEMDSPEQNETHKAPCTPCQGLYQAEINGGLHSLGAPEPQGQIQYLGGYWESLIGLGCVCVCLALL